MHCKFPVDNFEISSRVPTLPAEKYRLKSVVVHKGQFIVRGHYKAFEMVDVAWYLFDDALVSPTTKSAVKDANAYMLIYARIAL